MSRKEEATLPDHEWSRINIVNIHKLINPGLLAQDGLHYSPEGKKVIATEILRRGKCYLDNDKDSKVQHSYIKESVNDKTNKDRDNDRSIKDHNNDKITKDPKI